MMKIIIIGRNEQVKQANEHTNIYNEKIIWGNKWDKEWNKALYIMWWK